MLLATDIMTQDVTVLHPDLDVYEAIEIFLQRKITGAPVADSQNHLVGILSEKDCMRLLLDGAYHNLPAGQVKDFMTDVKQTVNAKTDILTIAGIFLNSDFRRVPVVDGAKLVGIITRRDVLAAIQRLKNNQG